MRILSNVQLFLFEDCVADAIQYVSIEVSLRHFTLLKTLINKVLNFCFILRRWLYHLWISLSWLPWCYEEQASMTQFHWGRDYQIPGPFTTHDAVQKLMLRDVKNPPCPKQRSKQSSWGETKTFKSQHAENLDRSIEAEK
jgi:hypothetical protein